MKKEIIVIILWALAFIGEVQCIIKFFECDFKESYKAEIIYGVSMCTGIGAVVGYMDFGK